ncbi:MAG TPA: Rieske 2Fe-2S domain-containing protein [Vicinamibacterales bacterium]|jgi:Rieske Fe-S protein|nr:Rieske 2Fe-2S domain-containing protein [Vicinamibacterales bacterium]
MKEKHEDACPGCGRREFLQTSGFGTLAALIAGVALGKSDLAAQAAEKRYPIPAADGVSIDHGASLIVTRATSKVYVFALSCPHENNAVKWVAKEHRFQCTKHDSQYTVEGVHTAGRATRNMDRYVIRRDGDSVVVDLHKWVQSDKDPGGWSAAALGV